MTDYDKAADTMLRNIEAQTGKTMAQLGQVMAKSGLTKHGELRTMLMEKFGLGHGHANMVVHTIRRGEVPTVTASASASESDSLDRLYSGKKAALRPVHDKLLEVLETLGKYEAAPKQAYISYRRKKQFTIIGPKTNTAVEIGLAAKTLPAHPRLKEMPPNSMCRYTTRVSSPAEVDAQVKKWIEASYAEAG